MNPYLVLNVSYDADDQTIRQAYLNGIKQATPDKDPQRFQELSQAYESIKDEASRLNYFLFDVTAPAQSPADVVRQYGRLREGGPRPLPFDEMKAFLRSCAEKGT